MLDLYRKIAFILDRREKKLGIFVLILTTAVAAVEVLGVASIMPFIALLAKPDVVNTNKVLSFLYTQLGFKSNDAFLFFVGIVVFIFLVGSTLLRAFVVWAQFYYANMRNYSISNRLVSDYLRRPYEWFLTQNSADLAASITAEVSRVVHGVIYPALRLISFSLISLLLLILFLLVDPVLAISIGLLLGVTYGMIFKFASSHLADKGSAVSIVNKARFKAMNEAFGGIKDVKINKLENYFLEKYRVPTRRMALDSVAIKLWAEMPSFAMQALVFGGMMLMILYLMKTRGGLGDALPVLAMYALGGYKLMPALQEIYKQLAEIKGNISALDIVYHDVLSMPDERNSNENGTELIISDNFELRNINYTYPSGTKKALDNLNFKIAKNSTVGLVGTSGSGKTTTVDIILGLLLSSDGGIYVDDNPIDATRLHAWQAKLGYVPQQIFLTDDNIAANIAFGVQKDQIDMEKVENAARMANLHQFIVAELVEGYNTPVGERGVRLSGGQRQRIGIARALYNNPEILILDEATSALDNITERAVMEAVKELGHKKTIILIAHRLSTVQFCDKIFLFDNGKIVDQGTFQELIEKNSIFREMAAMQDNKQ